ncbi:MAG: hypothetical protein QOE31_1710 [Solirubrobacteraceae bacterium]|nr:hypothetical protein [Solirubrobacteraceae bacterium]
MSRPIRCIAPLLIAGAIAVALSIPAASGAATTCRISLKTARNMGPTYVTQLKQSGTSCANAVKVTRAFHTCRLKHGKRGHCTTRVLHYRCTERRPADEAIPTQFTGYVTCKRSGARITSSYQQDT